jgi:plasmid stabilization system protein ParE
MAYPKKLEWTELAREDFTHILDYLNENWSKKVVTDFIKLTESTLDNIANRPKIFPLINKKLKLRKCVLNRQNSIYYTEDKDKIVIL